MHHEPSQSHAQALTSSISLETLCLTNASLAHHIYSTQHSHSVHAWLLTLNHAPRNILQAIYRSQKSHRWHLHKFLLCYPSRVINVPMGSPIRHLIRERLQPSTFLANVISSDTISPNSSVLQWWTTQCSYIHRLILSRCHHYPHTFPITCRPEAMRIISWISTYMNGTSSKFHTDRAKEYMAASIYSLLKPLNMNHTTTVPYNFQPKSIPEPFNRTIMDSTRCALAHSKLPQSHWHHASINTACKYIDMLHHETNETAMNLRRATDKKIIVFGSVGTTPHNQPQSVTLPAKASL